MTSNENHKLFEFNFKHINKRYFDFWDRKEEFIQLLNEQRNRNGFGDVEKLINILESPLAEPISKEIIERVNRYRGIK